MKLISKQSTLAVGTDGNILIDSTNLKANATEIAKHSLSKKITNENSKSKKPCRKDGIYVDSPNSSSKAKKLIDAAVQTDLESSNTDLINIDEMVGEQTEDQPNEYWQELAEDRMSALEISLVENQVLHMENEMLKKDNEELEEICKSAKELAIILVNVDTEESNETENSEHIDCEEESM